MPWQQRLEVVQHYLNERFGERYVPFDELASQKFKGTDETIDVNLGADAGVFGCRIEGIPSLWFVFRDEIEPHVVLSCMRDLHKQCMAARSYLRPEEMIDLHALLIIPGKGTDLLKQAAERIELDDRMARKLAWIWLLRVKDFPAAFDRFLQRTPFVPPWRGQVEKGPTDLRGFRDIVLAGLRGAGLSDGVAQTWFEEVLKEMPSDDWNIDLEPLPQRLARLLEGR